MRTAAFCFPLLLALAAGCEREGLAPLVPEEPEPEPEPCSDVAVEDACLVRSSFQLPGAYRFLGRADADGDGTHHVVRHAPAR